MLRARQEVETSKLPLQIQSYNGELVSEYLISETTDRISTKFGI
jgi:hypothetical protein